MSGIRKIPNKYYFSLVIPCLLVCCVVFRPLLGRPKANLPSNNPHSNNPHDRVNPAGIVTGSGGLRSNAAVHRGGNVFKSHGPGAPIQTGGAAFVKPAGAGVGSANAVGSWAQGGAGGAMSNNVPTGPRAGSRGVTANVAGVPNAGSSLISRKFANTGSVKTPKPYVVKFANDSVFLAQAGSSMVVKVHLTGHQIVYNKGLANAAGRKSELAAGDLFSKALGNINSLASTVDVPDPIGVKGPNPVHGGRHPKKGDGNPGGGNGRGRWGQGNRGNGVGNIWTGNQGYGVGEGMAGGRRPEPPEPPEPEEPEPELITEAAPLPRPKAEEISGCPVLMEAVALELGIEKETIQVAIEESLASAQSSDIQPCEAYVKLVVYAAVLGDPEGSRMDALIQVFNEIAPPDAPFTPEMAASIATALAEDAYDEQMPHYTAAVEYIDALVGYIAVLDTELGSPVGDSVTFVMEKYGTGITGSDNPNLTAYVMMRLEAIGG